MSRIGKFARRSFLIGSAAILGGVAFGYYQYRKPIDNPLKENLGPEEAALTPYVRIDANGVTIITPRAEMGQGAYTVLAALVAEELDLAWEDIKVDHGPPSAAYYNGAVIGEGLPFAVTDQGMLAQSVRGAGEAISKFIGLQVTGGSSTTADAFQKMRMAGATARAALIEAAVQKSGVRTAQIKTGNGAVILPDGRRLSYVSLAVEAASVELPDEISLKPESEWRYLGKPMKRIDMVAKSTGTAKFGIDRILPDMVYATVRTNPRLGGGVKSFEAAEAEAMSGVLKVIPVTGGAGVIAKDSWRAFKAAETIRFEWGDAPYPATSEAMFDEVAASFTAERQDSQFKDDGDVDAAFETAGAEAILKAEYRLPFLAHAPLEPMSAVAHFTNDGLEIWAGTQIPMLVLDMISKITGLQRDRIRLNVEMIGGSFGRRLEDDYIRQAVEVAQAMKGRPVKMTWTREEDMTHDFCRPLGMARMRGAVKDGRVETYDAHIAYPSVAASQGGRVDLSIPGPDIAIIAGAWDQPFAIPHYRVTGYRVPEMAPVSSWRSVGASGNGFFHDCFLDELIHAAGADPMSERIRLCTHDVSRSVLEAVAEMSNWGSPIEKGRGRGIAYTLSFGVPVAEVVEVSQTADGIRIDRVFIAADLGTVMDPVNVEAQMSGGVIWGLGHAISAEITYRDGMAEQTNFHAYEAMRLHQTPEIYVRALENGDAVRGIGEPAVPPAAPALANAIFAATGKRIRELPLNKHIRFV